MRFDLTRDDYEKFIKDLREEAKDPNRTCRGKPVLPPPPQNPADVRYIDIELSAGGSASVTLRIRRHDLYLYGYRYRTQDRGLQWYEFRTADGRHLIPGSEFLRFSENYSSLGGLTGRQVGYHPLENAINSLATGTDTSSSLLVIAVMICEAARFDKLLNIFAQLVRTYGETELVNWMVSLINSWGDLSHRLLRQDAHATDFYLPRGQIEAEEKKDEEKTEEEKKEEEKRKRKRNEDFWQLGISTAADAAACLGLLLGTCYLPPGLVSSRPPSRRPLSLYTNHTPVTKGQPLVEVFSVSIDNINNKDTACNLYGSITVTDGLGSFYLYNRARSNCEYIKCDDTVSLTGPYRSISLCQFFTISLNLKNRDGEPCRGEVSKGSFSMDIFYLSGTRLFGNRLCQQVSGQYGSASVFYAMFDDAVQAKVDVVLNDGDGEDPADVYGSLVAFYNYYEYHALSEAKKYYQTALFNVPPAKSIRIRRGGSIPLSRYTVAVPTTWYLMIAANLLDYDTFSRDDEIAKDVAAFPAKTNGKSVQNITGKNGSVQVTVTWSPLSDG